MSYTLLRSNFELNDVKESNEVDNKPIFLRLSWFQFFEKYIEFESHKLITISENKSFNILPMYSNESKKLLGMTYYELKSLTNYYSPFFSFTADLESCSEYQELVSECSDVFQKNSIIEFVPLYHHQAKAWAAAFERIGFKSFIYRYSTNWFHDGIRDLEHFWSLRPSRLRNTLKRKKEKLNQAGGYRIEVTQAKTENQLKRYLSDYHRVYYDSWKIIESHPAFIDAIGTYAWKKGELRLGIAWHMDIPVAAQIWFVNAETAYIYKLAHRSNYSTQSIGSLLSEKMFEYVITEDKVSCIDFLTGDDNYKKDWMQSCRPLYGVRLINPRTLFGKIGIVKNYFGKWINKT